MWMEHNCSCFCCSFGSFNIRRTTEFQSMELAVFFSLVSSVVAVVLILRLFRKKGGQLNLPPGKMGWPLIGEGFSFFKVHSAVANGKFMEQHIAKYGKIFKSNIFGVPSIISADAELIKFVLQSERRLFGECSPPNMIAILGRWTLLSLSGDVHKQIRSIAVNFMSSTRLRTHLIQDVETDAMLVLRSWKVDKAFSGQYEAKRFTFNFMLKHLLSLEPGQPETETIRKSIFTFLKGMVSRPIDFPGTAYRKALKARSDVLDIFEQIRVKRLQKANGDSKNVEDDDLMGWVMKHSTLTNDQLMDLLIGMLFGGYETSSVSISLAIYFLQACPRAVKELREENIKIAEAKKQAGESGLNWDDYKQMEFTLCVIKETLRLGTVARHLYRKVLKDIQYKGYDIPCGWNIIAVVSAVHLDPSIFEAPQNFNPWRWQDGEMDMRTATNHLPFGGGTRLCPGYELAKVEIAVFLHHLVLHYDWEITEPDHPLAHPYVEFPKGLPIKVRNSVFSTMKP